MKASILRAIASVAAREKMRYALNNLAVSPGKMKDTIYIDATDGRAGVRYVGYGTIDGHHLLPVSHIDRLLKNDECTFTPEGLSVVTNYGKPLVLPYADDGTFPDMGGVIPDLSGTAPAPMLVDPKYLGKVAALAEALGAQFVHVEWAGGKTPILWKVTPDGGCSFVVMPAKEDYPEEVRKDAKAVLGLRVPANKEPPK